MTKNRDFVPDSIGNFEFDSTMRDICASVALSSVLGTVHIRPLGYYLMKIISQIINRWNDNCDCILYLSNANVQNQKKNCVKTHTNNVIDGKFIQEFRF